MKYLRGKNSNNSNTDNYLNLEQGFPNCGSRPKSGSRSSVKWVAKVFWKYIHTYIRLIFSRLFVNLIKILFSSYHCPRSSPLSCQRAKLIKILTSRGNVTPPFVNRMQARVNVKMCLSMSIQTHLPPMFSHLLHLVHLSNPDDLHLKQIMLSHDHLQNLETVHLYLP